LNSDGGRRRAEEEQQQDSSREKILLKHYPGSPWILANDSRLGDQLTLTELHPREFKELDKSVMRQRKQSGIGCRQVEVIVFFFLSVSLSSFCWNFF
jgi:hypothetical protein